MRSKLLRHANLQYIFKIINDFCKIINDYFFIIIALIRIRYFYYRISDKMILPCSWYLFNKFYWQLWMYVYTLISMYRDFLKKSKFYSRFKQFLLIHALFILHCVYIMFILKTFQVFFWHNCVSFLHEYHTYPRIFERNCYVLRLFYIKVVIRYTSKLPAESSRLS